MGWLEALVGNAKLVHAFNLGLLFFVVIMCSLLFYKCVYCAQREAHWKRLKMVESELVCCFLFSREHRDKMINPAMISSTHVWFISRHKPFKPNFVALFRLHSAVPFIVQTHRSGYFCVTLLHIAMNSHRDVIVVSYRIKIASCCSSMLFGHRDLHANYSRIERGEEVDQVNLNINCG